MDFLPLAYSMRPTLRFSAAFIVVGSSERSGFDMITATAHSKMCEAYVVSIWLWA